MGAPTTTSVPSSAGGRLKREDFRHTKHDSAFSSWKILVGASDWKDHSLGKEGAEKYRMHNLPNCTSCPGVYELGVAVLRPSSGREARKLDSTSIIPLYLGHADNVRTRLQQYGREGAHLENGCSNDEFNIRQRISSNKGPGLFSEIFLEGFPIVYRWAPMKSKSEAEKTEAQLLDKFDYAWNKGSNGARRPDDILKKLGQCAKASQFSLLARKFQFFNQKQVGIKIKTCEPILLENGNDICTDMDNNGILSRIFKIGRSQPILVSSPFGSTNICGVAVGHGSICSKPPVEGRKRCAEHKGMKVNGFVSKLNKEKKEPSDGFQNHGLNHSRLICQPWAFEHPVKEDFAPICGVILDNGSPCKRHPVLGNKRCCQHKGRRVSIPAPNFFREEIEQFTQAGFQNHGLNHSRLIFQPCAFEHPAKEDFAPICGVILGNGSPCKQHPVLGNKRCFQHKGRRVSIPAPKFVREEIEQSTQAGFQNHGLNHSRLICQPCAFEHPAKEDFAPICGVILDNGSPCKRQPVLGNKRCFQHKGRRVSIPAPAKEDFAPTCGVILDNGSPCKRHPVLGNKRCFQHKGRRVSIPAP